MRNRTADRGRPTADAHETRIAERTRTESCACGSSGCRNVFSGGRGRRFCVGSRKRDRQGGKGGNKKWLRIQDSNLECLIQSQVCCRYTNPQPSRISLYGFDEGGQAEGTDLARLWAARQFPIFGFRFSIGARAARLMGSGRPFPVRLGWGCLTRISPIGGER